MSSFRLGPLAFSYFSFNYRLKVLDSSSSNSPELLIFTYNCSSPTLSFSPRNIYRAFFCTKALLPFKFPDKLFKNLPSTSQPLLFSNIYPINLMANYEIIPLRACVCWQSSSKAQGFHLRGIRLSPFRAWLLMKPF